MRILADRQEPMNSSKTLASAFMQQRHIAVAVVAICLTGAGSAQAGQAPSPPESMTRSGDGQTTIRAARVGEEFRLDGELNDAVYSTLLPATGFVQSEPTPGAPATEKTEVWVLFDEENVYVGARLWESQPDRMVVNEMRRDSPNIMQNENFAIFLDTFHDRRNGYVFIVNPIGGRTDAQTTAGRYSRDWNTIWEVKLGRFENGWTAEIAIPFKSLRYAPGRTQEWGFNARRIDRWKNELSHLTDVPSAAGNFALYQASFAATLVGIEAPSGSKSLELKPYVVSNLATDRIVTPNVSNDVSSNVGFDGKYSITQNLTADFSYNIDFAQAEADEQQVNLTRFSLFFTEKREFFLDNAGLYEFGRGGGDVPMLFYSRRIGLDQGRQIPVVVGGRLTGRVGRNAIGVVNIQTGERGTTRATNFSVVRLRRDVLRKSNIGLVATNRSVATSGGGASVAYGVDGTFAFFDNLAINAYWARTQTNDPASEGTSYRTQFDYSGDRYGLAIERLAVGRAFNPGVGFVRRADMNKTSGTARFSPRPRNSRSIRKLTWSGTASYTDNSAGRLDTRELNGQFAIAFQSSDEFNMTYTSGYELLPRPFQIATGIILPVGGYNSSQARMEFNAGQQRPVSGELWIERGLFYSGHRTATGISTGRMHLGPQISLEPTLSLNWVDLREGSFTTTLIGSRIVYTVTAQMFTTALVQYNSGNHSASANLRLRWEYRPGSEFFLVYNEERDTLAPNFPGLASRALIVKINRLLRF